MSLLALSGTNSVSGGYDIDNSLKLEENNLECINTPNSYSLITASNVYKGTTSFWIKRTSLNNGSGVQWLFNGANSNRSDGLYWDPNDKLKGYFSALGNGADFVTTQVFRDTSAWYHIVMAIDTSHSTASERIKIYVNGEQITAWDTSPSIDQNTQLTHLGTDAYHGWGTSYSYNLGISTDGSSEYLANCIHIDGQQLTSTDFGEFDDDSGIWKPKAYTGTYGNKGYLLEFQSSSALGTDTSGNGNNFTNNRNITSADQATDTPTNNFAIGNTLTGTGGFFVITEGATKAVLSTAGPGNNIGGVSLMSTLLVSSGKWYFEAQNTNSGDAYLFLGVADTASKGYTDGYVLGGQSGTLPSIAWWGGGAYDGSAKVYTNNVATGSSVNWETEVVGVALDLDNGKIYFHKSGTYINSGDPASGTDNGGQYDLPTAVDDQWILGVSAYNLATWHINFGGFTTMSISSAESDANGYGTFEYAPPSGYYALCTKNLAEYG